MYLSYYYRFTPLLRQGQLPPTFRRFSRVAPPRPVDAEPVIRVSNNIAYLGSPKKGPKPRQLLSLPPFPGLPLPGRNRDGNIRLTAASWINYYFDDVSKIVIQSHFNDNQVFLQTSGDPKSLSKMKMSDVMEKGMIIHVPVSIAETRIRKRFDTIPTGTLNPNADEIAYMQRLVHYKDSAIIVLNKPPKVPIKGLMPIHNSMDALAAAALSFESDEPPKMVHRLDRESSGLLLLGRTKQSISYLQYLFSGFYNSQSSSKEFEDACKATYQRYWALVIGQPKEKEGIIDAPLSKILIDDGKVERVVISNSSQLEPSQASITAYRVLGPTVRGCSWLELCPLTGRKHQIRVHCAEALGTPIVGDYKYGWFMHKKWKQTAQVDYEPFSGEKYRLRRPANLDVQKGSVLSKVPLLHLHCREMVLPNIEKFMPFLDRKVNSLNTEMEDVLRFVGRMPPHMRISWNIMSSFLI